MNRELAYALSFLFVLLSSLFYFNFPNFDPQTLFRFDFLSRTAPNNSPKSLPIEACDFSKGQWVWDKTYYSHKLYDEKCPFLDPGFRCRQNGRKDEGYRQWRWQPNDCDLPRYVTCILMSILWSFVVHPFYFIACMHAWLCVCYVLLFHHLFCY